MELLSVFTSQLTSFLTRSDSRSAERLISFHERDKLHDFSFPLSLKVWRNYIELSNEDVDKYVSILKYSQKHETKTVDDDQLVEILILESASWTFTIETIEIRDQHCNFRLHRASSYMTIMRALKANENYGCCGKEEGETVSFEVADLRDTTIITQYRLELVKYTVERLVPYSKYTLGEPSTAKHNFIITTNSNLATDNSRTNKLLVVGMVTNANNRRISTMLTEDYIAQRCNDMHLIAVHKYGIKVDKDPAFHDLIMILGKSAVALDLLEVKQSSTVALTADTKKAFMLYNSARLETLMDNFDNKVKEGFYKPLPDFNDVDMSQYVIQEEEWNLLKIIAVFPDIINRAINDLADERIALHVLTRYIVDIVNVFSVWYRRVRLFTDNREQLTNSLYVKVHLLKLLQKIFNETLALFSIPPIGFM